MKNTRNSEMKIERNQVKERAIEWVRKKKYEVNRVETMDFWFRWRQRKTLYVYVSDKA